MSVGELLSEDDQEPPDLVSGLLPWAGLSLIGAKPKAGKSTLARCLTVAVAQGRDFLGRECKRGPVVYLALEEKRSEVREHLRALGAQPSDEIHVHFGATPKDGLAKLAVVIARIKPVLCVIDPLFRFTRVKDASAYAELTNALGPVLAVARDSGCHLALVHHNTKLEREGADDILGSTAIFGAVDTALILRRRGNGMRFAFTVQRYGVDLPPTVLQLRGPWVMAGGELEPHEVAETAAKVVEFLTQGPAPEPMIKENVEGDTGRISKAIRQLVNDGKVGRSGNGKRGDPYVYSLVALDPGTPAGRDGTDEVCPSCGGAERDIVTGSGKVPSWRCLACGQLYGQLALPETEQTGETSSDEQDGQADQTGETKDDG